MRKTLFVTPTTDPLPGDEINASIASALAVAVTTTR